MIKKAYIIRASAGGDDSYIRTVRGEFETREQAEDLCERWDSLMRVYEPRLRLKLSSNNNCIICKRHIAAYPHFCKYPERVPIAYRSLRKNDEPDVDITIHPQ